MSTRSEAFEAPLPPLDAVIRAHGAWRVLLCAFAAMIRPRPPDYDAAALSDRLRRDVGLPAIGSTTRLMAARGWPGLL